MFRLIYYSRVISHSYNNQAKRCLLTPYYCYNTTPYKSRFLQRHLSQSAVKLNSPESLKPSSKVEQTVNEIKEKQQENLEQKPIVPPVKPIIASSTIHTEAPSTEIEKPTKMQVYWKNFKEECVHYYTGFKLLFIEIKISAGLILRLLKGNTLNRREYNLLTKTLADLFRLIPFSVFIIVPFMEFLLPVFLKFFPNMLPSTFQKARDREEKLKQSLKLKIEMAKILSNTLDEMVVESSSRYSARAKEFMDWFHNVKQHKVMDENELMRFVKLFEDEITLDSLDRDQLIALCRVLDISPVGNNYVLRQYLRLKIRHLRADDRHIVNEGIEQLNLMELQQACKSRGLAVYGQTEDKLRAHLQSWLNLSLNEKVPASLLLLSRSLILQSGLDIMKDSKEKLAEAVSSLSQTVAEKTKLSIGEKEGKVDNVTMLNIIKEEEQKVKEERKEIDEVKDKAKVLTTDKEEEIIVDKAPILETSDKRDEVPAENIEVIEEALDNLSNNNQMIVEKGEIKGIKANLAEYVDDVTDLEEVVQETPKIDVKQSKGAKRLFTKVQTLIGKVDMALEELEEKERVLKQEVETIDVDDIKQEKKTELIRIEEILNSIKGLQKVVDADRLAKIDRFLNKIDDDRDGAVEVDDVLKILEEISKENVNLDSKQFDELIELLNKEEMVEVKEEKLKDNTVDIQHQQPLPENKEQKKPKLEKKQQQQQ